MKAEAVSSVSAKAAESSLVKPFIFSSLIKRDFAEKQTCEPSRGVEKTVKLYTSILRSTLDLRCLLEWGFGISQIAATKSGHMANTQALAFILVPSVG